MTASVPIAAAATSRQDRSTSSLSADDAAASPNTRYASNEASPVQTAAIPIPSASSSAPTPLTTATSAPAATTAAPTAAKPIRGRPRSISISSGSPGPAPGTPLPSLYPTMDPFLAAGSISPPTVTPMTTTAAGANITPSPFANFSFGRAGGALSPSSSSAGAGTPAAQNGWGHRSSLSVPSLFAPSPLTPGSAPKGGRHRRTQSVSPPGGFPDDLASSSGTLGLGVSPASASQQQQQQRRSGSVEGGVALSSTSSSGSSSSKQPLLSALAVGDSLPRLSRTTSRSPTGFSSGSRTRTISAPASGSGVTSTVYASSPHAQHVLHELHLAQQQRSSSSSSGVVSGSPSSTSSSSFASSASNTLPPASTSSPNASTSHHHVPSNNHHHHHPHHHHHHATSHAALLQGVRSHAHPASPTLDGHSQGSAHSPQSMSPLSRSPSSPSMFPPNSHSMLRRRSSGAGSGSSPRPTALPQGSGAAGCASPPFGPSATSASANRNFSALQYEHDIGVPFALDEDHPESTSHAQALDEAMSDAMDGAGSHSRSWSSGGGGLSSPPLFPLGGPPQMQQDIAMSTSPPFNVGAGGCCGGANANATMPPRARRGSHSRVVDAVVSASMSPASLYLEQDNSSPASSPALRACSSPTLCPVGAAGARPISPPLISTSPSAASSSMFADTLFPTSGPLPPPGHSPTSERGARTEGATAAPFLFAPMDEASMLGIDAGRPSLSPPFRAQRTSPSLTAHALAASELRPVPALRLDLEAAPERVEAPPAEEPARSPPSSAALSSPRSPIVGLAALDDIPSPSSPHRGPVSLPLPPPLPDGPTGLPAHLNVAALERVRSRSKSRSRSRSRSPDSGASRALSPNGMKRPPGMAELTAHTPKVHSPLASPGVKIEATDDEDDSAGGRGRRGSASSTGSSSPASSDPPVPAEGSSPTDVRTPPDVGQAPPPSVPATGLGLDAMTTANEPEHATPSPSSLPTGPPASLGAPILPHISTSPLGTPEHVEVSLSPADSTSSYFTLPERTSVSSEPPQAGPSPNRAAVPPLERAPSWEDLEIDDDEDEDDFFSHDDGSGELGFVPTARRRSSGEAGRDRISILEELELGGVADRDGAQSLSGVSIPVGQISPSAIATTSDASESSNDMQLDTTLSSKADEIGDLDFSSSTEDEPVPDASGEEDEDQGMLGIDEELLSALERIFICAKSVAVEDRARVAHFLPDWLPGVDICEAVEYVLPLLAGFVEEESVKEVFAPRLDRIMWHFFSQCPLLEFDSNSSSSEERPALVHAETDEIQKISFASVETSPTSSNNVSDRSDTPPPTTKTSPAMSSSALPDLPRISAAAFTSLLGALLTDQSTFVAKATEAAVVRFLCRLKSKPVPPEPVEEPSLAEFTFGASEETLTIPGPDEGKRASGYHFSDEAKQVLEDEIVCGIVLGLARLDEDDKETRAEDGQSTGTPAGPARRKLSATPEPVDTGNETENPTLFLSPEEEPLDDAWLAGVNGASDGAGELTGSTDGGACSTTQPQAIPPASKSIETDSESGDKSFRPESSPLGDPIFSSFSPDPAADQGGEESAIGKMVAMSLIAAITNADCLDSSVLVEQFLPEVVRMGDEAMFYVRKEAVQALGALAKAMPLDVLQSTVLTLHDTFSKDAQWLVRRAAVLAVPSICARLPRTALRTAAVRAVSQFADDADRNVRSGALEICGELIYLFHEDPDGVPDEALRFFLGEKAPEEARPSSSHTTKPLASPQQRDSDDSPPNPFFPLRESLDSPSTSFLDSVNTWSPIRPWPASRDPEREILTAFNFPAVVLTLGRSQWSRLFNHHRELCSDPVEKVRQSLASSLHEVAKIIGPEQSDASLLEPLSWFVVDVDNVQGPVLDNLPSLLRSFTDEGAATALRTLGDAWNQIRLWRQRERVAKQFADFGVDLIRRGRVDAVLELLVRACKDSVAAVREAAVQSVAPLFEACSADPDDRSKLLAFLAVFSSDSSYRQRVVYTQCALACVRANIDRAMFENAWVPTLAGLVRDRVVGVRIAVARVMGEACKTPTLYSDPTSRANIRDILSTLADSPDRDVRQPVEEFCVADVSPVSDATASATPTPIASVPPMPLPSPLEAKATENATEDSTMQDVEIGSVAGETAALDNPPASDSSTTSEEDVDMAELFGEDRAHDEDDDEEDSEGGFVEVSKAECA
ncbi:hypothetical protein JCM10908_003650 [Rhodotorula pacifica]|uniref:uncharacterized protein n=1 Tax=Rhodotorula pacifica TaxID=1495444 RepID=UPI003175AA80